MEYDGYFLDRNDRYKRKIFTDFISLRGENEAKWRALRASIRIVYEQIDKLVHDLYGVTEEKIKVVEEKWVYLLNQ